MELIASRSTEEVGEAVCGSANAVRALVRISAMTEGFILLNGRCWVFVPFISIAGIYVKWRRKGPTGREGDANLYSSQACTPSHVEFQ